VELPEHTGEGRLAALVWAGDDEDPLGTSKFEVVGYGLLAFLRELESERQVERLVRLDIAGTTDFGIAEGESRRTQWRYEVQIGEVEPHLAIEPGYRRVDEPGVAFAELLQRGEDVGVQAGDPLDDLGIDARHVCRRELEASLFDRPCAKRAKVCSSSAP
jgi:hypothetical protein